MANPDGILLGLPLGYGLTGFILSTLPDSIDLLTSVTSLTWVTCITATFIISAGVSGFLSKRVKTIDMVGSLKRVE